MDIVSTELRQGDLSRGRRRGHKGALSQVSFVQEREVWTEARRWGLTCGWRQPRSPYSSLYLRAPQIGVTGGGVDAGSLLASSSRMPEAEAGAWL